MSCRMKVSIYRHFEILHYSCNVKSNHKSRHRKFIEIHSVIKIPTVLSLNLKFNKRRGGGFKKILRTSTFISQCEQNIPVPAHRVLNWITEIPNRIEN